MRMAFLSYSREDNKAENKRITALAKAITNEYGLQTGDELKLFIDVDNIQAGDKWKEKIEENIGSALFFIAIITPRYFTSFRCREELRFFIDKAEILGDRKLVLPILYSNVPELQSDGTTDNLIQLIKSIQWFDWTEQRLEDLDSSQSRKEIYKLALRLVEINKEIDKKSKQIADSAETNFDLDALDHTNDELGSIEKIVEFEESIGEMQKILTQITKNISNIGDAMAISSKEMTNHPKYGSFSYRASVLENLSMKLWPDVHALQKLTETYVKETGIIDDGIRTLLGMISENISAIDDTSEGPSAEEIEGVRGFLEIVEKYAEGLILSLKSTQGMIDETSQIEKLSRAIRPVLSTLRKSLTLMVESGSLATEWKVLVNTTRSSLEMLNL